MFIFFRFSAMLICFDASLMPCCCHDAAMLMISLIRRAITLSDFLILFSFSFSLDYFHAAAMLSL